MGIMAVVVIAKENASGMFAELLRLAGGGGFTSPRDILYFYVVNALLMPWALRYIQRFSRRSISQYQS